MRTIFAEYNPQRNSIDIYTNVGYMLRIDCWEAEKDLKFYLANSFSYFSIVCTCIPNSSLNFNSILS